MELAGHEPATSSVRSSHVLWPEAAWLNGLGLPGDTPQQGPQRSAARSPRRQQPRTRSRRCTAENDRTGELQRPEMLRLVPDMKVHARLSSPGSRAANALPSDMSDANRAEWTTTAPHSHSHRRARFRAVFDANYHRILGYAIRRTATREDAEDIVAETFLTAWRRLEGLPPGSDARPWLYGVARKVLANHRRGELRRERLTGRVHANLDPSLPHPADADHWVAWVAAAFARLGKDERELLALVAWEELDLGEIATVLGCSRNAVRIRLHRARRRLVRELQRNGLEGEGSIAVGGGSATSLISAERESGG
jgi:RNA polymerase sigma factor (sigma-70 family)